MASFSVVSNIASANAQANLQTSNQGLNKALQRLSSGLRINNSGDDAAGLAIANKHRTDQSILNQGIRNANDGLSALQIKDSALNNVTMLFDRMATLATQGASSTATADARTALAAEYSKLVDEIKRELAVAELDDATTFSVFVSSEATAADGKVDGTIATLGTLTLGVTMTDAADAAARLGEITTAQKSVSTAQNEVGILQNRLEYAISLATSQVVNKKAAESRIRDANIAEESANMTRFNILSQSGIAALAQANSTSASVLALLR